MEAEAILHELDQLGICVSSGSACTTGSLNPSHVLTAMGIKPARARGCVRFSLGFYNTDEEVDYLLAHLPRVIGKLREDSPLNPGDGPCRPRGTRAPARFDARAIGSIFNPFMNSKPHVAIVGATGAVGIEMIKTLEKRNFPVGQLTLLASARSAGKKLTFRGQPVAVAELTTGFLQGIDIALFSAGGAISQGICAHRRQSRLRGGG